MSNPEPGQPPDTANGGPYGPQGRIRYTHPADSAAPDDIRFYGDDTLFYEEDTLISGPESELSGSDFEPCGPEFGRLPDAAGETGRGPESATPADPAGGWPYDPAPVRFADPGDGAVPGDGTRPYGEWSHEDAVPAAPAVSGLTRNLEPPTGWVGGGFDAPGDDETRRPWDDPYPTAPPTPESPRRGRRPAVRPLTVVALALAVVAAGAGGALLGGKMASAPAAARSAAGSTGLSTAAGGAGGTASPQEPAAEPPAISKADAESVVASYSQVNNKANAAHSDSLLSTIEGGSSYTMDAGAYRFELGQSSQAAYVPFRLTDTTYYIPGLPQGSYPRWFAVKSTYVTMADGKNLGTAYVVFAQNAGAPWKDVIEPDILPGQALPQIAVDSSGYAQSVAPDAGGLNVAPSKIGQVTAEWLDQLAANKSDSVIKDESGNLTDLQDEVFWRSGQGGAPMDATDVHAASAGQVFALKTTSGGAMVFYTTAAQLTLTPANGDTISGLNIPGYYSPANSAGLTSATVGYVEQFATYIPPAGSNARDVVADISSIASRG